MPYMHDLPDELLHRITSEQDRYDRVLHQAWENSEPAEEPPLLGRLVFLFVVVVLLTAAPEGRREVTM